MIITSIYKGKDNRMRAYVMDDDGKPHTVSYPRILMAKKLGRPLKPCEDAHLCSKRCVGLYGKQEQNRRNSIAECVLNGEISPNDNPVPITESSVSV